MSELLDIPEICQVLRISQKTCRILIRSGALPTIRVGKLHRISKAALEQWLEAGGNRDRYPKTKPDACAITAAV
jgi:excisionase family DNA binding protein